MIAYRTNPPAPAAEALAQAAVTPITTPEIGIDVEHCLWAAAHGIDPLDVIHALGMAWPAERYPEWADALLAVRVAASRLRRGSGGQARYQSTTNPGCRSLGEGSHHPITHRRAA
jgi:hypothetical protein